MKIAVYGISKNEEANVKRFMSSCRDADMVVITDTGSTDNTVKLLKEYGAVVHEAKIDPWRFDKARNIALSHVPEDVDICISIDLDESLQPGWREGLEKEWQTHPGCTMVSYRYVAWWKDKEQTIPEVVCYRSKIHARHGYKWHNIVHERVLPDDMENAVNVYTDLVTVHHHRQEVTNYIGLLTETIKREPDNAEAYLLRASDYLTNRRYPEVLEDSMAFLSLTKPNQDEQVKGYRAYSWLGVAKAQHHLGNPPGEVLQSLLFAVAECPTIREPWVYLADAYMGLGNFPMAYGAAMTALSITSNGFHAREEICWGDLPKQIASSAFSRLNDRGFNYGNSLWR